MTEKNPMGLRLEPQRETHATWDEEEQNYIVHKDYELVEADGGRLDCPMSDRNCGTNCTWFFTVCNIPEKLGLEVPKP